LRVRSRVRQRKTWRHGSPPLRPSKHIYLHEQDIEQGHSSSASCILANLAMQLGRALVYEPARV